MKKIMICGYDREALRHKRVYTAGEGLTPVSGDRARYPICAFLKSNIAPGDEFKIVLVLDGKVSPKRVDELKREIHEINSNVGANIEIKEVKTELTDDYRVIRGLIDTVLDEIDNDCILTADIELGSVLGEYAMYTAVSLAERGLGAVVEQIIKGRKRSLSNRRGTICDLTPIYNVQSIGSRIMLSTPCASRAVIKGFLTM